MNETSFVHPEAVLLFFPAAGFGTFRKLTSPAPPCMVHPSVMSNSVFAILTLWLLGSAAVSANPKLLFESHCIDCHDADSRKGGLDLASLKTDLTQPDTFATWVKIHDVLAKGEMPPAKKERPPAELLSSTVEWLQHGLVRADRQRLAQSGRIRMRRLTRAEYENSLRDALALERLDVQGLLPADGAVGGFKKNAGALDLSPAHLSAYAAAAEKALSAAIATRSAPPPVFQRRIHPAGLFKFRGNLAHGDYLLLKDLQLDPALPPRGGFEHIKGYIHSPDADADREERKRLFEQNAVASSQSSVGLLMPNLAGYEAAMNIAPIFAGSYRVRVSVWGFLWNRGQIEPAREAQAAVLRAHEEGKQQEGGRLLQMLTADSLKPGVHEFQTWLEPHESLVFDPVSIPWRGLRVSQVGGRAAKYFTHGVALDWFEIEGPHFAGWPPESHKRLFGDLPIAPLPADSGVFAPEREKVRQIPGYLPAFENLDAAEKKRPLETVQSAHPEHDARKLLTAFLKRAFRRPVSGDDVEPYVSLVQKRLAAKECFEDAMRRAYVAALTSPEMLFIPGTHPEKQAGEPPSSHVQPKEERALARASRLAYWLWNSPPDEDLLAAASDGSLEDPEKWNAQVERMLRDPRSERFVHDFADQWLELDRIQETTPDKQLYPEYSFLLHEGMVAETRAFLRELIDRNLPALNLVRSDFAMLTQRLAEHYGVAGVQGVETRRVSLPSGSHRGGLLTQSAILKLTANGTTTSPVKRGVWVMDRILNDPAPPPPPGVSQIDPDTRGATTIRQQLDLHRKENACAACHSKIDPAGFALECFDPVGGFRTRYRSTDKGDLPPERETTAWHVRYTLGPNVDASGKLPDGASFSGIEDLQNLLAAQPARLARAFVAHLSRYATGTEPSFSDREVIASLVDSTAGSGYGIRSLILALARSPLFLGE